MRCEFNKDVILSKLLEPKEPPEPIKVNQGPPGKVRRRGKKYSLQQQQNKPLFLLSSMY